MKLQDILNIKYPFIQGGMANIATGEFAAKVSNAGGLGLIASGGLPSSELEKEILIAKKLTNKPFGINLMLMNPESDKIADLIIEQGIQVVTTGAGNPAKYIEKWKNAGIKVFPVIPNPTIAIKMDQLGVDGIIAEGMEAGGHIGKMTTMTLLPQVIEKVNIPVIAAGGIASGKQMLAAEILGACGFQMGTIFLATKECPIHQNYKDKIISSKDTNVTVMGYSTGLPVRVLRNSMTNEYLKKEASGVDKMELEKYTLGSLRKAVFDGDVSNGSLMAGLVVGQIKEEKTIEQLMYDLYNEYLFEKKEFCKNA